MTVVYLYVAGDLPHYGHLMACRQARALGDCLIVGVLTDEAIEKYKRKPVIPFNERREMFAEWRCVDFVVTQYDVDPTDNLKLLPEVDIVVHGDDWDENFPGAEYMRSVGKKAVRIKYYQNQSTTKIIKQIKERTDL